MPRRKVVRTIEEEEEFYIIIHIKREKQAKWQAEERVTTKQKIINKNCQSLLNTSEIHQNILQPSTSFSKSIVIDSHVSINSSMKIVYPTNETVTIASQAIDTSINANVPLIRNSNEITVINNNIKLFNVNDDVEITDNTHNSAINISLNSNINSQKPSTSSKLTNLDNNKFENLILHEESSQNIEINDETVNLKSMDINIINKNKQIKWYEKKSSFKKRIHRY